MSAPVGSTAPLRRHAAYAAALALDLVGAGGALLVSSRTWQTVTSPRPRPRPDDVLDVTGRTVDSASTALALVALAGVVAVLATRGIARRVVGVVVAVSGLGLVWRGLASASAISAARARSLVSARHRAVVLDPGVSPHVAVHAVWPTLSVVAGVLVLLAGVAIALRGHRWGGMSARYENVERTPDPSDEAARKSVSLWNALDRGEDPTSR